MPNHKLITVCIVNVHHWTQFVRALKFDKESLHSSDLDIHRNTNRKIVSEWEKEISILNMTCEKCIDTQYT